MTLHGLVMMTLHGLVMMTLYRLVWMIMAQDGLDGLGAGVGHEIFCTG